MIKYLKQFINFIWNCRNRISVLLYNLSWVPFYKLCSIYFSNYNGGGEMLFFYLFFNFLVIGGFCCLLFILENIFRQFRLPTIVSNNVFYNCYYIPQVIISIFINIVLIIASICFMFGDF